MGSKKQRKQKTRLDLILSLVGVGMMIATVVLDELDRRKRAPVRLPEEVPDETREEIREEMQEKEQEALQQELEAEKN